MMMRPRHYSTLNRAIARSITYSLRNNNRQKYHKSNYNNTYNQNNISTRQTENNDTAVAIGIITLLIMIGLAIAFPVLWIFYLVFIIGTIIFK